MAEHTTDILYLRIPVLVVDDDEGIVETLTMLLEDEGYPVLEARDGQVALDILAVQPPPLIVLTDHHMPVLDGPGLLRRVLQEPTLVSGHAYIYMTAGMRYPLPDVQELLVILQVQVLLKPLDVEDVLETIAAAVRRLRGTSQTEPESCGPR